MAAKKSKSCPAGKVKSGPRKGLCRKRKLGSAQKKAMRCKGNTGAAYKACISSPLHGMRRRSY